MESDHRIKCSKNTERFNSLWLDKGIRKTKTQVGRPFVDSKLMYGNEVCTLNDKTKRRVNTIELDYIRRNIRISRRNKVSNDKIKRRMNVNDKVTGRTRKGILNGSVTNSEWMIKDRHLKCLNVNHSGKRKAIVQDSHRTKA